MKFAKESTNIDTDSDSLDNLKLDTKGLSASEQERLDFIQKLTDEADDLVKAGGFSINNEQDEEEIDRAIKDTQWSGQSDVEMTTVSQKNYQDLLTRPGLAFGDVASFIVFALIGRSNHKEDIGVFTALFTAAPFIISWLGISPFFGAYTRSSTASKGNIPTGLVLGWGISMVSALSIRGVIKGAVPPTPFIIVSLLSTFTLLCLWRLFFISAFGSSSDDEYKDAGFMEVFRMVGTLVKRW